MRKIDDRKALLVHPWMLVLVFGMALGFTGCAAKKKMITPSGLYGIKLGDRLPPIEANEFKGVPLRDTILEDQDYSWRAALMSYEEGLVYLEEDFSNGDILNRIRVETPELKLKNGLRVGKTVADLQKIKGEWFISPLQDFGVFDCYSRSFPNTHFLIPDKGMDTSDPNWQKYRIEMLDPTAPIQAIVIF